MPNDSALGDRRASLQDEAAHLREQLTELGFGEAGNLSYDQNFADSSQVTAERSEAVALATSLQETLDEVERALAKFEDGTYGVCEQCGKEIAPARLEAMPTASLCINCASRR